MPLSDFPGLFDFEKNFNPPVKWIEKHENSYQEIFYNLELIKTFSKKYYPDLTIDSYTKIQIKKEVKEQGETTVKDSIVFDDFIVINASLYDEYFRGVGLTLK